MLGRAGKQLDNNYMNSMRKENMKRNKYSATKTYTKNSYGFKDCSTTYLAGGYWLQWDDDGGNTLAEAKTKIEQYKTEYPTYDFKSKKMDWGYRIYYHEK